MAMTLCELRWLRYLLYDLRVHITRLITLYYDSQTALHVVANPVFHERTKHIEIDCHFVRDAVQAGFLPPYYLCSDLQPTDIFTEALQSTQFYFLLRKLNICNLYTLA